MRIAVGGLHTESGTLNPVPTRADDFRQLRGLALLEDPYFAFLRDFDATFLPTLHARALPGGPVDPAAYDAFKAEILDGIARALPLDGVYLAMHGAMYVAGREDAEALPPAGFYSGAVEPRATASWPTLSPSYTR